MFQTLYPLTDFCVINFVTEGHGIVYRSNLFPLLETFSFVCASYAKMLNNYHYLRTEKKGKQNEK